jgi:hypothetical protein
MALVESRSRHRLGCSARLQSPTGGPSGLVYSACRVPRGSRLSTHPNPLAESRSAFQLALETAAISKAVTCYVSNLSCPTDVGGHD